MLSVVFLHVLPVRRFAPDTGYIFFEAPDVCCLFAHVGALDIPKNAIDLKTAIWHPLQVDLCLVSYT